MTYYYSPTTQGFYVLEIHPTLPADALELTGDQYNALFDAQAQGAVIQAGPNGIPVAVSPASLLTVADVQAARIAILSINCQTAIESSFPSSALASPHTYPSRITDQRNLSDAMSASLNPGLPSGWTTLLWCEDLSAGSWAIVAHSAAQVQQVHADWLAFRQAAQQKLVSLTGQVQGATSVSAVEAVVWTNLPGQDQSSNL